MASRCLYCRPRDHLGRVLVLPSRQRKAASHYPWFQTQVSVLLYHWSVLSACSSLLLSLSFMQFFPYTFACHPLSLSLCLYLICRSLLTLQFVVLLPSYLSFSVLSSSLSQLCRFLLTLACRPLSFHYSVLSPPPPPPPSFSLSLSLECFFPHSCSSSFHPPFFSVRKWSSLMALIPSSNNLVVLFGVGPPHSVVTWESGTLPYSSAN